MDTVALCWWQTLWVQASNKLTRRLTLVLVSLLLILLLTSPLLVSAYAGLGGYISEKLLGRVAGTSASLYLGDSADGPVVLGSIPVISTLAVTDAVLTGGATTATLRGNLANLNGMPQADVWFVWGYGAAAMGNTTPANTIFAPGDQTAVISGYNANLTVFYQFQSGTDGTALGAVSSFKIGGGVAGVLLWNILTVIMAAGLFIFILRLSNNPITALIGTVIGLMAIVIVRDILLTM